MIRPRSTRVPAVVAAFATALALLPVAVGASPAVISAGPSVEPLSGPLTGDLTVNGRGSGHGFGLSQWGAYGYASDHGWTSAQILNHYYGGTVAATVPATTEISVRLLFMNGHQTSVVHDKGQVRIVGAAAEPTYRAMVARPVSPGSSQFDVWARSDQTMCAPVGGDLVAAGWSLVATSVTTPAFEWALDDGTHATADLTNLVGVCAPDGSVRYHRGVLRAVSTPDPRNASTPGTISELRIEQYLRSVVSKEMSPDWGSPGNGGMAALEAQAVAARSYALAHTYNNPVAKTCDTTRCQVYAGAAQRANLGAALLSNERIHPDTAIANTSGLVRRVGNSGGAIALTMYAASSGGYTDKNPYLVFPAVADLGDVKALTSSWGAASHQWTVKLAVTSVEAAWPQIGKLTGFTVLERNGHGEWGGRVRSIRVHGTNGQVTVTGDQFQSRFGFKSNWFTFGAGTPLCEGTAEPPVTGAATLGDAARFAAVTPSRIVDTRIGLGAPQRRLGAGCTIRVVPAVPAGATAVVVNITTVNVSGIGFVTAYPCGTPRPWVSMSQSAEGRVSAATAIVPLGNDGSFCVYSPIVANVVVDLFGYYAPDASGRFSPVSPARVFDQNVSRETDVQVPIGGLGGVPASGVEAVAVTVHAIAGAEMGYVTAYPCGTERPYTSVANALPGQSVANHAQVRLDAGGRLCVFTSGSVRVMVDVTGWFGPGGQTDYFAIQPDRVVDTRIGQGVSGRLAAGQDTPFTLAGQGGVPPSDVKAVIATVTYVRVDTASRLTVHPCLASAPDLGMVRNLPPRHAATTALVAIDGSGRWCVRSTSPADFLVDVVGWYG